MFAILAGRTLSLLAWGVALTCSVATASAQPPDDRPGQRSPRERRGEFGPKPGDQGGPPDALWTRFNEEERERLLRFMEEHFPTEFLELQTLRERRPLMFRQRMRRLAPEMRHLMELMQTHPERASLEAREFRLQAQIRRLAMQYGRSSDDAARREIAEELRERVGEAFDCQAQIRQLQIRELEARLSELRTRVRETRESRDQIIDRRVDTILNRAMSGPPESPPAFPPGRRGQPR